MDYDSSQIEPVRKMVSFEFVEDPGVLSVAVAQAVRELYHRAGDEDARVLGWTATFEQHRASRFQEGMLTVAATKTGRKRAPRTAAQMEAEIMDLLSMPRGD